MASKPGAQRDPSTLGFVLLGAIAREPATGYDLAGYVERRVSHYFSTHLSQIYPELKVLKARGYVDVEVVRQKGRPAKKIYSITLSGRGALSSWVTASAPRTPADVLVRTHAVWLADPVAAAEMYRALADHYAAEAAHFDEVLSRMPADPPPTSPLFADVANLTFGKEAMAQQERWARRLADRLGAG